MHVGPQGWPRFKTAAPTGIAGRAGTAVDGGMNRLMATICSVVHTVREAGRAGSCRHLFWFWTYHSKFFCCPHQGVWGGGAEPWFPGLLAFV
jgi:hypothetical protein